LREDIDVHAEWIARALVASGYAADFTPASAREVDRFIEEHSQRGRPLRKGLLKENLGKKLFALGAYVGEVLRRDLGGSWVTDDADAQGEINVMLLLTGEKGVWPVQKVTRRFQSGSSESLGAYVSAIKATYN
jgi:hypothetical protein